jgi:hypothetical protein
MTLSVATEFEYPAHIVWACAAAADRVNGGYRKESQWSYDVDNPGRDMIEQPNNKTQVLRWLELWRNNLLRKDTVTEQDVAQGQSAREFWQSQMLLLLDDKSNEYLRACVNAAHKETIADLLDVSVIASSITAAKREARKQALLEKKQCLNSQHVCSIGSTVIFDTEFEVIDSRYIDKVGASAVECIVEGNLYDWWSKTHVEPGVYRYLKGRVRDHNKDYGTGQPVTRLNYVKVHQ